MVRLTTPRLVHHFEFEWAIPLDRGLMTASRIRLTEELRAALALCRRKGATEADVRAAIQNRDDHDVGHADGTHDQCHRPEPEKERLSKAPAAAAWAASTSDPPHGRALDGSVGQLNPIRLRKLMTLGLVRTSPEW
jgi:hypothetical protein